MYRKTIYVFQNDKPLLATVRQYERKDIAALIEVQKESFPPPFSSDLWWSMEQLEEHITRFPEGALCVETDGEIAGSMTALRINHQHYIHKHQWEIVTDDGYIRNHNPDGDTLYVVDISVKPTFRKYGLGKLMMQSMYHIVIQQGISSLMGGARMPGYGKLQNQLSPEKYIEQVVSGQRKDPVVSFLLRCGRVPVTLLPDYLEDEESAHYALLMEWKNPFI
ncbi:GNAT family N-acetyltransferase [Chengkuizengella axinellae]|uniref:GNAT family N-acetyltransferase n=1 Tax=Chengkuizengella axinellae TaxID=3064388 RepID=A0ABT9J4C1_9BACL|nr:GNAT family N-acetyltransferase [Chengkuizengella sp. 2205SS18-9]MDP5276458.1 GNAT family N-acetyltransferase [Chengkuizengella sp. 2205SS18-9]